MIDGLVSGRLYGAPQDRTAQNGKTFVTAKMRATTGGSDTLFVNVIAFSDTVKAALLALHDGDSLVLSGTLTPKVWTVKHGDAKPALDMVAHGVLSAYHVKRKRQMVNGTKPDSKPESNSAMNGAQIAHRMYGTGVADTGHPDPGSGVDDMNDAL